MALLQMAVLLWYIGQGLSSAMLVHQAPPWRDRIEEREVALWLRPRLKPNENVAAYDKSVGYYTHPNGTLSIDPSGSLAEYLNRCHRRQVKYVIVDLHKECMDSALLRELASNPRNRPGLAIELAFRSSTQLPVWAWNAPTSERQAVVYRLTD